MEKIHGNRGKKRTLKAIENISRAHLGIKPSLDTRNKMSESHKNIKPWNRGLTKENNEILAKAAIRRTGKSSKEKILPEVVYEYLKKFPRVIRLSNYISYAEPINFKCECDNIFERSYRDLKRQDKLLCVSCIYKNMWKREGFREKTIIAQKKAASKRIYTEPNKFYNTTNELLMKQYLTELGLIEGEDYIFQYPVKNGEFTHKTDFFFPLINTIIETDGNYWHANPRIYSADELIKYPNGIIKKASEVWEKDRIITEEFEKAGYKVLRFWEGEFNKDIIKEKVKLI
jgi:G:T-mismatch repair DNA endonuclease (very short patch repair protein)